jgi:hypothetical protein
MRRRHTDCTELNESQNLLFELVDLLAHGADLEVLLLLLERQRLALPAGRANGDSKTTSQKCSQTGLSYAAKAAASLCICEATLPKQLTTAQDQGDISTNQRKERT